MLVLIFVYMFVRIRNYLGLLRELIGVNDELAETRNKILAGQLYDFRTEMGYTWNIETNEWDPPKKKRKAKK